MSDIFSLAKSDQVEKLQSMFDKGIGVKAADEDGRTLLHHAASHNALRVIALLVSKGAPLDVYDNSGFTVRP